VDKFLVDIQLEFDHADVFAWMKHHIIQRRSRTHQLTASIDVAIEQKPLLGNIFAFQYRTDFALDLLRQYICEEAEAAAVNPKQRYTGAAHAAGSAQQAAVPTDDYHQVTLVCQSVAVQSRKFCN